MIKPYALALIGAATSSGAAPVFADPTGAALRRCLDADTATSTSGQSECESVAARRYDQRMNAAYAKLMRRLPADAAARLRLAQRAWLAFRTTDDVARSALYETRRGTMYVPMQAAASANVIRDRAIQLEDMLRVLTIEE